MTNYTLFVTQAYRIECLLATADRLDQEGGVLFKFNYSIQIHTIHHSMSDYDYISMLIKPIIAIQIR